MIYNPNKQIIPFHPTKHWYYTDKQCDEAEKIVQKLRRNYLYHLTALINNDWSDCVLELFKINGDPSDSTPVFNIESFYNHILNQTYLSIDFGTNVGSGLYYIRIKDDKFRDSYLYSEPFCIKDGYVPEFTLRWSNECLMVGNIVYPKKSDGTYRFHRIHLDDITVVLSDTQTNIEVIENEFGEERPISHLIRQKYMFSVVLPFYLIETLSTLPLHSEIYLDCHNKYSKKFSVTEVIPELEEFGCLGKITVKFETNSIIKSGCCDEAVTKKIDYNPHGYDENNYSTT